MIHFGKYNINTNSRWREVSGLTTEFELMNLLIIFFFNYNLDSSGKTDLARGLEELDDRSNEMSYPRSNMSDHAYSAILSPPPTLPSTPSDSGTILFQTPIPPHETPIIPIIAEPPTPEPVRSMAVCLFHCV